MQAPYLCTRMVDVEAQNAALVLPHFDLIYFFLRLPPCLDILLCPIDMAFGVSDLCRGLLARFQRNKLEAHPTMYRFRSSSFSS